MSTFIIYWSDVVMIYFVCTIRWLAPREYIFNHEARAREENEKKIVWHHRAVSISVFMSVIYRSNKSFSMFFSSCAPFAWLLSHDPVYNNWLRPLRSPETGRMATLLFISRSNNVSIELLLVRGNILHGVGFHLYTMYIVVRYTPTVLRFNTLVSSEKPLDLRTVELRLTLTARSSTYKWDQVLRQFV